MGERPLVCGEALAEASLARKGQAEQPLGVGESRLVVDLSERLDRLSGEALHLHRIPTGVRPPPLQPELDLQARGQRSFAESGRGFDAFFQQRLGLRTPPAFEQRVAELALDTRALARVGDAELERSLKSGGALGEGPGCEGRPAGSKVVVDAAFGACDSGGLGEVVGERGQHAGRICLVDALQRLADLEVELPAADAGDAVVDGSAHELVGKAAGGSRLGQLLDEPGPNRLLERGGEPRRFEPGGFGKHA